MHAAGRIGAAAGAAGGVLLCAGRVSLVVVLGEAALALIWEDVANNNGEFVRCDIKARCVVVNV